jgi:hypothetical protein
MLRANPMLSILNNPIHTFHRSMYFIAKRDNSKDIVPKNNGVK